MTIVHHQTQRPLAPALWWIAAAFAIVLALSAWVLPDSKSLERLRAENRSLTARQAEVRSHAMGGSIRFDADLEPRVARAEADLAAWFPTEVSELDVYELLRWVAALDSVSLAELQLGDLEPTANALDHHPLGARPATLRGHASLADLRRYLGDLRELGQPLAVVDFELTREGAEPDCFAFSLSLSLYERMAALPTSAETWSQP